MNTVREQTQRLAELLRIERGVTADFLLELAAFDRAKGWVELGYASLFDFLHLELKLSRGNAHYRKTAAELLQKVPGGRAAASGWPTVPHDRDRARESPHARERGRGASSVLPSLQQEAMALAASLRPVEHLPRRNVVTAVRPCAAAVASAPAPLLRLAAPPAGSPSPARPVALAGLDAPPLVEAPVQPVELARPARGIEARDSAQPLDGKRFRLRVTVSDRFMEKLHSAENALSHTIPDDDWEAILERGLDLVLAQAAKRRGIVETPRNTPPPSSGSDHVPSHVAREVWTRDGGRCQWPLDAGGVCGSPRKCELDHVVAKALGGKATVENLRVLCRFHNQLHARRTFGDAWMDRYAAGAAAR